MGKKKRVKKVTRDRLETTGLIKEACPAGMFRVEIGDTDKLIIIGVLSGKMRQNFIKIVPGDWVIIELSEYDTSKGRITKRLGLKGK